MNQQRLWIALLAILTLGIAGLAQQDVLDAETILDRVNAAWQGDSFHGIMALDIVLGGQTKSHKLEVWTLGEELALIRVLEPEIDLNSGYLQLGDDLWYYSPMVGSIKLPTVALGDALFGAGPSLEDLSHGTLSDDYETAVKIIETDGVSQYFLTLVPHPDAPVVYGKLEITVSADYVMEKLIYYDQRETVVQTATFTDIVDVGDRRFATTITIEDAYGDQTIERIESPQFDLELNALFFSLETFEAWGDD
ncbi:MAG: outer membrane lipoprotein-sorting protein [Candidatus Atribacteria bacterium]|nr:MAG: outer membrane lipoprotein-sorting protein [Candidatus Atribacteria bacterium]